MHRGNHVSLFEYGDCFARLESIKVCTSQLNVCSFPHISKHHIMIQTALMDMATFGRSNFL